jgi:hypothetical protein
MQCNSMQLRVLSLESQQRYIHVRKCNDIVHLTVLVASTTLTHRRNYCQGAPPVPAYLVPLQWAILTPRLLSLLWVCGS